MTLLFMPEGSAARGWYAPATTANVEDYLRRLTEAFQVPLIDARCWVADAGFLDGIHLRPEAAIAFSERFGREVLQPLLQGFDHAESAGPR